MSDPQKYRTKEEVEGYKKQDPIEDVRATMLEKKWATEAELETMDDAVKKEVEEAVKFAQDSPMANARRSCTRTCTPSRIIPSRRTEQTEDGLADPW